MVLENYYAIFSHFQTLCLTNPFDRFPELAYTQRKNDVELSNTHRGIIQLGISFLIPFHIQPLNALHCILELHFFLVIFSSKSIMEICYSFPLSARVVTSRVFSFVCFSRLLEAHFRFAEPDKYFKMFIMIRSYVCISYFILSLLRDICCNTHLKTLS